MIAPMSTPENRAAGPVAGGSVYVWLVAIAGALGGLLFGYDWVVIGGAEPFYERYFHLTSPSFIGWAMSCALVGCLFGALSSGPLSNRFGRKRLLISRSNRPQQGRLHKGGNRHALRAGCRSNHAASGPGSSLW